MDSYNINDASSGDLESGLETKCERNCNLILKILGILFVVSFIVVVFLVAIIIIYVKETDAFGWV